MFEFVQGAKEYHQIKYIFFVVVCLYSLGAIGENSIYPSDANTATTTPKDIPRTVAKTESHIGFHNIVSRGELISFLSRNKLSLKAVYAYIDGVSITYRVYDESVKGGVHTILEATKERITNGLRNLENKELENMARLVKGRDKGNGGQGFGKRARSAIMNHSQYHGAKAKITSGKNYIYGITVTRETSNTNGGFVLFQTL